MSLSYDDLQAIRKIVEETVIKGELEALGNDVKEIYSMIASIQNLRMPQIFRSLTLKKRS